MNNKNSRFVTLIDLIIEKSSLFLKTILGKKQYLYFYE